jgi:16S rRNA (guanine(527)-N(7))-methyltransferase RsmG
MFNSVEYIQKSVTHHQQELFYKYVKLILEWNKKINITSRHNTRTRIYDFICEGIAMSKLMDNHQSLIVDIGSGAGFPGIILTILGFTDIHLIEINYRKAAFLQYALAELGLKAKVHNIDVKNISLSGVDYITSKAVTRSDDLMSLSRNIISPKTQFILCKNSDDGYIVGDVSEITLTDRVGVERQYKFIIYRSQA